MLFVLLIFLSLLHLASTTKCYRCIDVDPTAPASIRAQLFQSVNSSTDIACKYGAPSEQNTADCKGKCVNVDIISTFLINGKDLTFYIKGAFCQEDFNLPHPAYPQVAPRMLGCLGLHTEVPSYYGARVDINGCTCNTDLCNNGTKQAQATAFIQRQGPATYISTIFKNMTTASILDCTAVCSSHPFCQAVAYIGPPDNGTCQLSYKQPECNKPAEETSNIADAFFIHCLQGDFAAILDTGKQ